MIRDYSISREVGITSRRIADDAWVVCPKGHLDSSSVQEFKNSMLKFIEERPESGHLLVDMAEVPYISSLGLGALIELQKMAGKKDCSFALYDPQISVRRVFEISKLDFLLVRPDSAARQAFASYFSIEEPLRQKKRQAWEAEHEKKSKEIEKNRKKLGE